MSKNNSDSKLRTIFKEYAPSIAIILVVYAFRSSFYTFNHIPSGSMLPTLQIGEEVLVNKMAYDVKVPFTNNVIYKESDPKAGDIITFNEGSILLIKRIMGVPGDAISVVNDIVYINGKPTPVEATKSLTNDADFFIQNVNNKTNIIQLLKSGPTELSNMNTVVVPPNHYFMVGDNRRNSKDSRYFGFVDRSQIEGKATTVLVHFDNYIGGLLPGSLPSFERSGTKL